MSLLLGDCLHPGGGALTERLGHLMNLTRDSHVVDVASGRGTVRSISPNDLRAGRRDSI